MIPEASRSKPLGSPDAGLDELAVAIGRSTRVPLLLLFSSAAVWAVIASVFALVSSIKFHSPTFLAGSAWLTYGRVRPAYQDALIYGFCLQAALGTGLWLIARLGRTPLLWGVVATVGGIFWNVGVTVGVVAVLAGENTGFEFLEMPGYAAVPVFVGWILIGLAALLTLHYRKERRLHPSLWFVLAALFWFPWIYSTATLLLLNYPVRGVAQAVIAWWFGQNLLEVCFDMLGFAVVFYFVARFAGRELHSRYLALFAFWILILFTGWGGIPNSAPVPAWMPAVSTVATAMNLLVILAVALNVYGTLNRVIIFKRDQPEISFILLGVACFIVAGVMRIVEAVLDPTQFLHFTWFLAARWQLQVYGFFALVLFGAAYFILPAICPSARLSPKLVRAQFWISLAGIFLAAVPLAIGGIIQSMQLQNPKVPFLNIMKSGTHFLRVSTMGDLLLLAAHVLFLINIAAVLSAVYRARVLPAYAAATEDLFKAEGKA
jgi:cytochrome c oxidase cbb3-type subunit 1